MSEHRLSSDQKKVITGIVIGITVGVVVTKIVMRVDIKKADVTGYTRGVTEVLSAMSKAATELN